MASPTPVLSIVIPAYNEEARLPATIEAWRSYLRECERPWEILVVDDGSRDRTAAVAKELAASEPRISLLKQAHSGKGAAVKAGMLSVTGKWRFMADADLSMRPSELEKFFDAEGAPRFDVTIGSREAPGARRVAEPSYRHVIGRAYNHLVRLLLVDGIDDTQCGYKLFTGQAAEALFSRQSVPGFGFDVEILFLAQRLRFSIGEIPLTWHYDPDSRVSLAKGLGGFVDIARIGARAALGRYSSAQPSAIRRP